MLLFTTAAKAQVSIFDVDRHGSLYLSIGTHSPSYKASTIHISQGTSGNDYDLENVTADDQSNKASSILNASFRLGYFFNNNQDLAIELSYDPLSYHVTDGQKVTLAGQLNHTDITKTLTFSEANGYYYYINGSNHVLVNLVKRFGLYKNRLHTFYVDALAKAGAGPLMPSISNSIEGKKTENPGFQVSGWNADFEAALRLTIYKYVYVEGAWKYDWASYSNMNVYDGTASQKLSTTSVIFSLGFTISTTERNPRFDKVEKLRPVLTIGTMNTGNID
jgi:hypothetical protein